MGHLCKIMARSNLKVGFLLTRLLDDYIYSVVSVHFIMKDYKGDIMNTNLIHIWSHEGTRDSLCTTGLLIKGAISYDQIFVIF